MPVLIGFLALVLALYGLRVFTRASPAAMARMIRKGGGAATIALGLFFILRGRIDIGLVLTSVGMWLYGAFSRGVKRFGHASAGGGMSRVRSAMIEMELDHSSGAIRGTILAGKDEGKRLDALTRSAVMELYRHCRSVDPEGARLLEVYLDRRFAGWRQTGDGRRDAGGADAGGVGPGRRGGTISEDEAYEILGLKKGAARQDIARAHRDLMKKLHPDHGGTTDLAARVNEAKDVLMRRHHH
ncbi:DnaJ domain-containing protein [Methylosinus sp. H3A]|uniref:DnaJ domain-containing protein n=1 Tax=Methylosinus sp. H3A TaxID=2785786 RepID=UPI0018C2E132|nr:DnaJ domain-containing protein [Methylosinus sp. H3A]MBG0811579.1 DnaJ domain-containing protein [Methylosinus sp. H3A]